MTPAYRTNRRLHVTEADLKRRGRVWGLSPLAVIGGLIMCGAFHLFIGVVLIVASLVGGGASAAAAERAEDLPEEPVEVIMIEGRMLKLGGSRDERRLPTKMRETVTTGQRRLSKVPTRDAVRVDREEPETPAENPQLEDLIQRAGEESEREVVRDLEGDVRGVEGGMDTEATDEQAYIGRLQAFFRRGFQMPPGIPEEERGSLRAAVSVTIGPDGTVQSFNVSSSGNSDFDRAVHMRLDQARGARVPDPPSDAVRQRVWGRSINFAMVPPR